MVRSKLERSILYEIKHYLHIPYWINQWKAEILLKHGPFGGKGSWKEIDYATRCAAELEQIDLSKLKSRDIYQLRRRHHIGIDCSGLAYHLLDHLDQLKGNTGILFKVYGPQKTTGVRSISADYLTSQTNSSPITNYQKIQTGDLIRFNSGHHVIFIIGIKKNIISYIHSSNTTLVRGVHTGKIYISQPELPLSHQKWTDKAKDKTPYSQLFNSQKGDGIFRLNCFST